MQEKHIVGVVGNPNCGKTTLFNALTGAKQQVGNWPGVTVERKVGFYHYDDVDIELVDLPGTYSLDATEEDVSLDEKIARDYVAEREADVIINIVDASNLERNLYLTSQLLEMRVPTIIAVNMLDVATERGIEIDLAKIEQRLGCPVVGVTASTGEGVEHLKQRILEIARSKPIPNVTVPYAPAFEAAVEKLIPRILESAAEHQADARWFAVRLLEGDSLALQWDEASLEKQLQTIREETETAMQDDIDIVVADARYSFVNSITREAVNKVFEVKRSSSNKIDRIVLNRVLGIPIFLAIMYLMFMFTINLGSAFIDFFDILVGTVLIDGLSYWLTSMGAPDWLVVILANGVGGGIQVVATFIPVIGFLFLFLSLLEDSGYMARAAFIMDRAMRFIGLPGKAFVPMLVGFGCNVPAIMATRTLENHRDRILTIMMNPFMSCGARLPVYALFAVAFFPTGGQNLVFGLYLIGIAVAVMTGLVLKSTILQGKSSPFVMELPPYHLPTVKGILLRTWDRLKSFLSKAGRIIIPMVLVLNFLNALGTDGSFGQENSNQSVLSEIGRTIAPAFSPMGLDKENWPAAVGIFTGVLAKEAVVGTLDSLYSELARSEAIKAGLLSDEDEVFNFWDGIQEAFSSVSANMLDLADAVFDPLGLDIGNISDAAVAAEEQEVSMGTFGAMQSRFDGKAGAFAYLLFILLYFPCVAATAAVYREIGLQWAVFVAAWTTGIAYTVSTIFYQTAVFMRHPAYSTAMVAGMLAIITVVLLFLKYKGKIQQLSPQPEQV